MPIILLEMQQGQYETDEAFDKKTEEVTALLLNSGWRFCMKQGETMIQIRHARRTRVHKAQFLHRDNWHTTEEKI